MSSAAALPRTTKAIDAPRIDSVRRWRPLHAMRARAGVAATSGGARA